MSLKLSVIDRGENHKIIDIEEGQTIRDAIEDEVSPENYGLCGNLMNGALKRMIKQ